MESDAALRHLHPEQGGPLDVDADNGACIGASDSGQRNRTRPDLAEPAPIGRTVRAPAGDYAARARNLAGRDLRGGSVYPCGTRDDGSNDRAGWRPASRLGATKGRRIRARMIDRGTARETQAPQNAGIRGARLG